MSPINSSRRQAMVASLAALPMDGKADDAQGLVKAPGTSRVLVAYFSRSGNTRVVAGLFQRAFKGDLFEIRPAQPYPDEYLATVEEARQERDSGLGRAPQLPLPRLDTYDTVYLGFPIWGETAPPLIRSFLSALDFTGKTIVPFVTHGGYGLGNSQSVLASVARGAKLLPPFVMEADQERRTMNLVNDWLVEHGGPKAGRAS